MMTCRLLCALLVLALCCCPSVCVTANVVDEQDDTGRPSKLAQDPSLTADSSHSNAHKKPVPGAAVALPPSVSAVV
ncbi:mucin, putative, partial [Trypanosoma cruzi]